MPPVYLVPSWSLSMGERVRTFEISPCGDPYSRAWDALESDGRTWWYRGDISGIMGRHALTAYLRRVYPDCRIRVVAA